MALKLDPSFPLVWRTPSSLQFGIDSPRVVLSDVTAADERMIAALTVGVSRSGLTMIGHAAGGHDSHVKQLLESVNALMLPEVPTPVTPANRVAVMGHGKLAEHLKSILHSRGIRVEGGAVEAGALDSAPPNFAIVIAHFVIEPELHGLWLRRDVPHLPIVFGDRGVRVGPLVEPGVTPCLYCVERTRTDTDPAWPAIASQLWGRNSPVDTPLIAAEVAAMAARIAEARLCSAKPEDQVLPQATSIYLDAERGTLNRRAWESHAACACLALPENDSVGAPLASIHPRNSAPSSGAAAAVPA